MNFNRTGRQIFNNQEIEKREKTDKLFVVNELTEKNQQELWVSTRAGKDKKMLQRFPIGTDWRIDVYNQKVLFIYRLDNAVKVESMDW